MMTLVNLLNTFSIALSVPTGNENFQMEEKNKIEEVVQDSFEEQNSLDFPTKVKSIRFFACHSAPSGDRNKGRICLDNIEINFKFSL